MGQMKRLREVLKIVKLKRPKHRPDGPDGTLPTLKQPDRKNQEKKDNEELDLLKCLILDNNVSVIPQLLQYRKIKCKTIPTKKEVLEHYQRKSCTKSNFRLNNKNQVSFKNGFFYHISEPNSTIINYDTEVIPVITTGVKTMTDTELDSFIMSNSISVLACNQLEPKMISIHTPHK